MNWDLSDLEAISSISVDSTYLENEMLPQNAEQTNKTKRHMG